jgi:hypothetical protein
MLKNKKRRRYIKSIDDHSNIIYFIPEENYIGMTKNIVTRLKSHNRDGLNLTGTTTLARFDDVNTCRLFERVLQNIGFDGNMYITRKNKDF